MKYEREDTVVAIATSATESTPVGIIRVSGSNSKSVLSLFNVDEKLQPNFLKYIKFKDDESVIDDGYICFFSSPNSYTGEDQCELQIHGNVINLRRIKDYIVSKKLAVDAFPGEFTYRALKNGKISFSQAMAINEFIKANDEAYLKEARKQIDQKYPKIFRTIKDNFLEIRSNLELLIDVEDLDKETESSSLNKVTQLLEKNIEILNDIVLQNKTRRQDRFGLRVVIIGPTNAGKSSLFNAIVGEDRVLASDVHGTTRDTVKEYIKTKIGNLEIVDTAGFRDTNCSLEIKSQEYTKREIEEADVVLLVFDIETYNSDKAEFADYLENKNTIVVLNKVDKTSKFNIKMSNEVIISAKNNLHIDLLLNEIGKYKSNRNELNFVVTDTQVIESIEKIVFNLEQLLKTNCTDFALYAMEVKDIESRLDLCIAPTLNSALLDHMFSNFCVGK